MYRATLRSMLFLLLLPTIRSAQPTLLPVTNVGSLSAATGTDPEGSPAVIGNAIYFTCFQGGLNGHGSLVAYVPGVGLFNVYNLYGPTTGSSPRGGFHEVGTDLYFTCYSGGANAIGTLARYSLLTGLVTKVLDLSNTLGGYPTTTPILVGSDIYFACTNPTSSWGDGVIVKFTLPNGPATQVAVLSYCTTGSYPTGSLVQVGNSLYLACRQGYTQGCYQGGNCGSIVGYDLTTSQVTPVAVCPGVQPNGLVAANGLLHFTTAGTTASGPGAVGTFDPTTGLISYRYISPAVGIGTPAGEPAIVNGMVYVTGSSGSTGGGGVILANALINPVAHAFPEGSAPLSAPVALGSDLYFTCSLGGAAGVGSLLRCPQVVVAESSVLGTGCGSPSPVLSVVSPPVIGQQLTLGISMSSPFGLIWYIASYVPPGTISIGSCQVFVDLGTMYTLSVSTASLYGANALSIAIPNVPLFSGIRMRVQAAILPQIPLPGALYLISNGVELLFGY